MILTVCLNPALDVTYTVPELRPGASHRIQQVRRRAGGKGVNVASVLHQQGLDAVVAGLVGGSIGTDLISGLDAVGIRHRLTPIEASTRQTVTVVAADDATVLNEPGPTLSDDEWATFRTEFAGLVTDARVVTMSGSLPQGVSSAAYAELTAIAAQAGAVVVLDCEGEALIEALHAAPAIVKINEHEAAATTGIETDSRDTVFAAAEELHALGAREVVITRGAEGVLARTAQGRIGCSSARRVAGNPTGAGDAFTAGLAAAIAADFDWPGRLRRASAWAAASVAKPTAGELDSVIAAELETTTTVEDYHE